jgi:shikimate dehydrogenase
VHARYLHDLPALGEFDLIVNATSATRGATLPTLPISLLGPRTAAVDLSYGEAAIAFLAWARANGTRDAIDGLGMLVEQAAEAFFVWRGVMPDTAPVLQQLRAHLRAGA